WCLKISKESIEDIEVQFKVRSSIIVIGIFPTCLSNMRQHCKVIDIIRLKCDFDTDFRM
ncbi:hypothetical protein V1477_018569, partial [Vespula maculifrons]